ncbi:MAG: Arm DNA-binding domain-containing protein, partial [Methyloceanibacter sp.]
MPLIKKFTEEVIKRLEPIDGKQTDYFESRPVKLFLRCNYGDRRPKTWMVMFYVGGKPRSKSLGSWPALNLKAAREAGRLFLEDPLGRSQAKPNPASFRQIADEFIKRHVDAKGLRSKDDILRDLRYASTYFGDKPFLEIRRGEVTGLLDHIEDTHSRCVADDVLGAMRGVMRWHQTRDENYTSPIVPGMKRDKREASEKARAQILNDDEIRAVWSLTGSYADFLK